MTLVEKLQALAKMAEQGRDGDVYSGLEYLLRTRPQPSYVRSIDDILDARDFPAWLSNDRPVNLDATP